MKKDELFHFFKVNLDMAIEAHELLRGQGQEEIAGVTMTQEKTPHATVTTITIETEEGSRQMGRPLGQYVTIEAPSILSNNYTAHQEITEILGKKLITMMALGEDASILLVGLGNWNATPDALGPQVVNKSLVTRHLFQFTPAAVKGKLRKVSAITPGVLGLTGIETAEIIRGIVEHVHPDLVIAIDSLAAGSLDRIGASIQLADTGISPGSGVGNRRMGLTQETIGCKILAIGVPTVVNAAVIAHHTLEILLDELKTSPSLYRLYKELNQQTTEKILTEVLSPFNGSLMVTPKEIDTLIDSTARIIAGGLGMSLHPEINEKNYAAYFQ
ncbi:MAG: GPR endopeptidase [Peptococcaceae bacterium]|jgi:spore protease|nr:GPR endopeptidase [Peptococcaceae bacterium]